MNYDRKKQEELLYNEKVRQANMQSDAIEMSNMIPLEKDYKYQMSLMTVSYTHLTLPTI